MLYFFTEAGENSSSQANIVTHLQHYGVYIAKSGRQKISDNIPTHEQLMAIKHKKKVIFHYLSKGYLETIIFNSFDLKCPHLDRFTLNNLI